MRRESFGFRVKEMNVRMKGASGRAGLSLVELMVLVGVMALIALVAIRFVHPPRHGKSPAVRCVNNLKNTGLSFRIFATENGDRFPAEVMMRNDAVEMASIDLLSIYRSMSNLLSTPKILYCPMDTKREPKDWSKINFNTMTGKNISYFASLSAEETMPQIILAGDRNLATNGVAVGSGFFAMATNAQAGWTKEIHVEQGIVVMSDGSVQQMSSGRLKEAIPHQDVATNYILIP